MTGTIASLPLFHQIAGQPVLVLGDGNLITPEGDVAADTEQIRQRMVELLREATELRTADAAAHR